jgi:uncharacterized protein YxjI
MKLSIKGKIMSLHNVDEILDEGGKVVYTTRSKISIWDKTTVSKADGTVVSTFKDKLMAIHKRYYVTMADGVEFELADRLFHINDIVDIPELGWVMRSKNFLAFDFVIYDGEDNVLATASRDLLSMLHEYYYLDIVDEGHVDELVTLFVIMRHIIQEQDASEAAIVGSMGSSS